MKHKIAITGGHHNSALPVAKELISSGQEVIWLGHKFAAKKDTNPSAEYIEVTASGIKFFDLKAGKIGKDPSLKKIARIPLGFLHARKILAKQRPALILSFGNYLGLTTAFAGRILNIPVYLHEQTSVYGKANKAASNFAAKIYLTWPSSAKYFPQSKTEVVGLPLRSSIISSKKQQLFNNYHQTILILGGKQGSHFLNNLIFQHLDYLLQKYNLIHQTGMSSVTKDLEKAQSLKQSLKDQLSQKYHVYGYITEDNIGKFLKSADFVISRSGAHTVYELALLSKKCLLIPFMHTYKHDQLRNARILENNGQAIVLAQSKLTHQLFLDSITKISKKLSFKPMSVPQDAAKRISRDIINDLNVKE